MTVVLTVPHSAPRRPGAPSGYSAALTTTVPREYVHRSSVTEVFLTGWRGRGPGAWTVDAQWPRAHSFYGPAHGMHDPVMLVETVRQAGLLLNHVGHGIPLGHPVIWGSMQYIVDPEALEVAATPADVEVHVNDHDIVRRGSRLSGMRQTFDAIRDGRHLGRVECTFTCHAPAVYRRLRGSYADLDHTLARVIPPAAPVSPALVGRDRTADVVLSPTGEAGRWQLRTDTTHPVLFDHPVDHVPGMLLVEAARQAAYATVGHGHSTAVAMDCSFVRYAELDVPCWIRARALTPDAAGLPRVAVRAEHHGDSVFTATVTCAPIG
ncbi:ScbA/BarX family gamma-butyrolactone biosynthesis protein [Streptomyces ochraceiscleroticus]|uniref:ScbA/BarX family gamma-butyrolactone biosynthesis protein n=1 Tax=Streptomyces ochraceiscleroticus TaxID=47761 RepID=A0ABW1MUT6_9ACTN|nr:ScbA/BarX family gamma-butyrolactone biosynthesis protein [Streptomyces ochraceiscleroticus]